MGLPFTNSHLVVPHPVLCSAQGSLPLVWPLALHTRRALATSGAPPGPKLGFECLPTYKTLHCVCTTCALHARHSPKERMSPKTCPYLTLTTIAASGHYNTVCRQISACSAGSHYLSGASRAVEQKPFPTLRLILNNCTCLPFGAGFGEGLASSFGMRLGFLFLGTKLSSTISLVK